MHDVSLSCVVGANTAASALALKQFINQVNAGVDHGALIPDEANPNR